MSHDYSVAVYPMGYSGVKKGNTFKITTPGFISFDFLETEKDANLYDFDNKVNFIADLDSVITLIYMDLSYNKALKVVLYNQGQMGRQEMHFRKRKASSDVQVELKVFYHSSRNPVVYKTTWNSGFLASLKCMAKFMYPLVSTLHACTVPNPSGMTEEGD